MAGNSKLLDPALRRLRAIRMIERRIENASLKDIAREFNVDKRTVERTLSWAKRAQLLVKMEDQILEELVPAAKEAILDILKNPEHRDRAEVAVRVFEGTIPGFSPAKGAGKTIPVQPEDELSRYIEQYRTGLGVIDGHTTSEPQRALPPATPQDGEESVGQADSSASAGEIVQPSQSESVERAERSGIAEDVA